MTMSKLNIKGYWALVLSFSGAALFLASCASIPPVGIRYYLPQSSVNITVQRLIGCTSNDASHRLIAVDSHTIQLLHTADPSSSNFLELKGPSPSFGGREHTFTFSEDGRVNSVNTDSSGYGQALVKGAISVSSVAPGLLFFEEAGLTSDEEQEQSSSEKICKYIQDFGIEAKNTPKHIILRYTAQFEGQDLRKFGCEEGSVRSGEVSQALEPALSSLGHLRALKERLQQETIEFFDEVKLSLHPSGCRAAPVHWALSEEDYNLRKEYVTISARQPALAELRLAYGNDGPFMVVKTIRERKEY